MADDTNIIETIESPTGGFYGPQDISIDKLNIITASGDEADVKKLLIEFSYYEDIYSFVVSGYIILKDAIGLVEKLQLTGKEFLEVNFGKARGLTTNNDFMFRLYAIPKRTPTGNLNTEFIKLYFCSEELLLSEQTKVTKSYSGTPINKIIYDILVDKMKVKTTNVFIEPTLGNYDFNVNTLKPFEAISWVSCYARPTSGMNVGADMLLYETQNGFNFRSINSLMKQPIYNEYIYQPKNLENSDFGNQLKTVLEYEFIKTFNNDTFIDEYMNDYYEIKINNKIVRIFVSENNDELNNIEVFDILENNHEEMNIDQTEILNSIFN